MLHVSKLILSVFMALLTIGCMDFRPVYSETALSNDSASLKGIQDTYINEIDGARVSTAETINANRGNMVRVSPGKHRFGVVTTGMSRSGQHYFTFDCEAGHHYELCSDSDRSVNLVVIDVSTGKKTPIN
jgi:hypothetical protein